MKYSLIALTLAAAASAQSVTACDGKAQKCIDDASAGICDLGDWACGCTEANMGKIQAGATTCVITACGGATGALAVISEVQAICEEPTEGTEEPEPTESTGPCKKCNGTTPEQPKPTGMAEDIEL
ncbi:unnamed protein product [Parascedosporium putredinis]|uniref:CFEM domain-containing protein n=1 Tax=Parascedosporium putredinis TaxID=1442378 RepID=A0A9P1GZW2_9PEZI|nr:unnamed protein product [Parascedosporium putredinis]CAI7991209.1 unnamed protein product [Parascedosporium putredinis]